MATASKIIERALTRLGIRAAETPVEASEAQDGLSMLNDMLASWESVTPMGFSPVSDISDEVRIPRQANAAVIDHLAVSLAPEYGRSPPQSLIVSAQLRKEELLVSLIDIGEVNYPATLPIGSGNQCPDFNEDQRFFRPDQEVNF